ncbi:MAG: GtrA family protein [Sulfurisoma sp.]|nr:GtrA family protein [Sulfurisoma sp.]
MSEKARFLLIGAYNTAFGYGVFALLYVWIHQSMHYLVIAAISHLLSVTHSFLAHRYIVFRDRGRIIPAFLRFNAATAATLAFGLLAMTLLVEVVGIAPLISQAIVIALSTVGSYLLHRRFTFRMHH